MYYVYMVRCADGSHYTGLARHLCRRMREHVEKRRSCAKYTRSHPVVALDGLWRTQTRAAAARLEYAIKRLTKEQKQLLLAEPERASTLLLEDAVEAVRGVDLSMCLTGEFNEE